LVVFESRTLCGVIGVEPAGRRKKAGDSPKVLEGLHKTRQDVREEEVLEFNEAEGRDKDVLKDYK
jgi:hypothetical protein